MAYWKPTKGSNITISHHFGDGLHSYNDQTHAPHNEVSVLLNMECKNYPIIETRRGLKEISPIAGQIGQRNNSQLHMYHASTNISPPSTAYLWGYTTDLSNGTSSLTYVSTAMPDATFANFIEFNPNTTTIYSIMSFNSTVPYVWDGTNPTTTLTQAPSSKIISHKNRLWGYSGKSIKFSALNNITDWTTINDAGSIYVASAGGNITNIISLFDRIIIFTNNSIHELTGTGPDDFSVSAISFQIGCPRINGAAELNGVLYFAHYNAIYAYAGGQPQPITAQIEGLLDDNINFASTVALFTHKTRVYVVFFYDDSSYQTIYYDTVKKKWYNKFSYLSPGIDRAPVVTINDKLYGADQLGTYLLETNNLGDQVTQGSTVSNSVNYQLQTNIYKTEYPATVKDMWLTYEPLSTNLTMELSYSTVLTPDLTTSTDYKTIAATTDFAASGTFSTQLQKQRIICKSTDLTKNYFYRYRLKGTGNVRFYDFTQNIHLSR